MATVCEGIWTPREGGKGVTYYLGVWSGGGRSKGKDRTGKRSKITAVIVDTDFPWWFSPALSVDITVTRIWLTSYQSIDYNMVSVTKEWCTGVDVEMGESPSKRFVRDMRVSQLILVGGRIPDGLVTRGLWESSAMIILSTSRGRNKCPRPWLSVQSTIKHCKLGGVTDASPIVICDHQMSVHKSACFPAPANRLRKDLRWVLKGGVEGIKVDPPKEREVTASSTKVNYVGKGEISQSSLWPVLSPGVLIHTVYRHNRWVKRPLSNYEKILAMDAPERLLKLLPNMNQQEKLLASMTTPIKILQHWIEHVSELIRDVGRGATPTTQGVKRKAKEEQALGDLTWECFQARKSRRIMLASIPESLEAEELEVKGAHDQERPLMPSDHNLAATKNDSALVPVGLWDRYLEVLVPGITRRKNFDKAALFMRGWLLRRWKKGVTRSFFCLEEKPSARSSH